MARQLLAVAVLSLAALGAVEDLGADDFPTFGVAYGAPSGLSGFVKETVLVERSALLLQAQAGLGGGEVSVGGGRYLGRERMTLVSVSAVANRPWNSPRGVETERTLVGARLECTAAYVFSAHVGVLYPVGAELPRSTRVTWGIGIGLPLLWTGPLIPNMTE